MARPATPNKTVYGPGNRLIVTTLLETLTARERRADRDRVARAAGCHEDGAARAPSWLSPTQMSEVVAAAKIQGASAKALGHRLVAPESLGMALYRFGLATPEKAYRRAQTLLPRELETARWEAGRIAGEEAALVYRLGDEAGDDTKPSRTFLSATCSIRQGMLEAIPTLYGLLPAIVEEEACLSRGDDACRYRIRWSRGSFRGVSTGLALGLCLAPISAWIAVGSFGLGTGAAGIIGVLLAGSLAVAGRSLDLTRQLDAVGGARRGQLALFDQVDDQLASKLDALARVDAKLDAEGLPARPTRVRLEADSLETHPAQGEPDQGILFMADSIHSAAGDLEVRFEAEALRQSKRKKKKRESASAGRISEERALLREIREWSARIAESVAPGTGNRRPLDLARLVGRATASVRPLLPRGARILVRTGDEPHVIDGNAVALEKVLIQLIRNAIDASESLTDAPEVVVSVDAVEAGIELAVEDRGTGIDSTEIDEVFDPFFAECARGPGGGLPGCLEIVEAHGGALRIEAEERAGTRVSILFPESLEDEDRSRPARESSHA